MPAGERSVVADEHGREIFSFVRGETRGKPWADQMKVSGAGSAEAIITGMRGWFVTASAEVSGELIARGARAMKQGYRMSRDLANDPPPPHWADADAPAHVRITPSDRPAEDLIACWRAAYAPEHPDHFTGSDEDAVRDLMGPLLAGTLHGPLRTESALAVDDATDSVVGCVLVNQTDGTPPYGGPWVTELFRAPGPAFAGLGGLLLKRAIGRAAANGLPAIGLVVTLHNPAFGLYQAHGFRVIDRFQSVEIPEG
jgi:GNAT superfamily N-acetyltransferase